MSTTTPPDQVLVVMGVSGSGKTTLATQLALLLGWDLTEGDDLHPASNVDKMRRGTPLTDEDRGPWLDSIADWIQHHRQQATAGVITCSALKASYRDRLRGPGVRFVHVTSDPAIIRQRLHARTGHFMPAALLESQLLTLEAPTGETDVITVDAAAPTAEQAAAVLRRLTHT